jgi:hypothetical protein
VELQTTILYFHENSLIREHTTVLMLQAPSRLGLSLVEQ